MMIKYFFIGLIIGVLFPYILQLFDLLVSHISNHEAVYTTKVQKEIDDINNDIDNQGQGKYPMGFQVPNKMREEVSDDE